MAFLKSSQITGLSAKDIDVKGFTQADSSNLGDRAYTEHEVLLADAYKIVGNVTVSDDLILSKLSDDGDDITITGDTTTRTISGSGSIQGATLAQTPNASLTSMTGELSNAVTGTLGTGITFPTGHIIQTVYYTDTTETNTGAGTGWKNTSLAVAITPTATSSLIMITYSIVISINTTGYSAITSVFRGDVTGVNLGGPAPDYGTAFHGTSHLPAPHAAVVIDTPSTTSATTYTIGVRESADNQTYYCSNSSRATNVVQEIAG